MPINLNIPALLPEDVIARAKKLNPALLCDGMKAVGGIPHDGCMEAAMMPVNQNVTMVGTAYTVKTANGDNFPIHVATYNGGSGYVLVVDGGGYRERAYLGDLIMGAAQAVGYEGIVVDGCVRDTIGCRELGFPVYSKGVIQDGPVKKDPGEINVPVVCGGISVNPGDLVVGGADGVTVVPRDKVYEVLEKAEAKAEYEENRDKTIAEYRRRKEAGEVLPELAPQWVLDMLKE